MKYLLTLILGSLALAGCDGKAVSLNGSTYVLKNGSMPVTLGFDANEKRYFGKAVNNYFGPYEINGSNITFKAGGATMMMGAPEEMEAERAYLIDLSNVTSYQARGDNLTLTLKNGKELKFEKQK